MYLADSFSGTSVRGQAAEGSSDFHDGHTVLDKESLAPLQILVL